LIAKFFQHTKVNSTRKNHESLTGPGFNHSSGTAGQALGHANLENETNFPNGISKPGKFKAGVITQKLP